MKATQAGQIVAKALGGYNGQGIGEVLAFVNVSWFDPTLALDADGNLTSLTPAANTSPQFQLAGGVSTTELSDRISALSTRIAVLENQTAAATQAATLKEVLGDSTVQPSPPVDLSSLPATVSGELRVLDSSTR